MLLQTWCTLTDAIERLTGSFSRLDVSTPVCVIKGQASAGPILDAFKKIISRVEEPKEIDWSRGGLYTSVQHGFN